MMYSYNILAQTMSGYPTQGGYGGQQSGYPGAPSGRYPGALPPQQGGYGQRPGAPPSQGGYRGYSGAPSGVYPGALPQQQQGGYAQRPGAPPSQGGGLYGSPPPGIDPQTQQWFNAVDQDRSGQISAQELQKALVNGNWSNFSEEACRLMIGKKFFEIFHSAALRKRWFVCAKLCPNSILVLVY